MKFLIYFVKLVILCSPSLAWNHGDSFNTIIVNDSVLNKDLEKLSFANVMNDVPKPRSCYKPSTCVPIKNNTCFGVKLAYTHTSISLTGVSNLEENLEKLEKWRGLMHVPRCWAVIQPFLCSLYMPKCENNTVFLPSKEMCEVTRQPCRILIQVGLWPEEFNCDSYESKCKNNVRELKFNTTGRCKFPLVRATREASYYESIEGCGIHCHNPYFSEEERQDIRTFIKWCSFFAFFWNFFAVMTLVIDWRASQKYPTRVIFFMNMCFLLDCLGYMYQFLPWTTDASFCHKDGTLRTSEPSIQENVYCVTHFIIVYYFFMAGLVWFNILAYTWLLRCKTIGGFKSRSDQRSYYHIVAWSAPFVMVVTISALNGVDGDGLLGICFVSKQMRTVFLLGPLVCCSVGVSLFIVTITTLLHLKMTSNEVTSETAKKKICESIVRLLIFLALSIIFIFLTFVCQLYELQNQQIWKDSFRRFIVCQLGVIGETDSETCRISDRPGVLMVQLQLIALFGMHINAASWLWTCSTVQAWSRFIKKKFLKREVEPTHMLTKHEIIARAFARRQEIFDDNRLSISIYRSHQDPVGLDFELNSVVSDDRLSTTWFEGLCNLVRRRGAVTKLYHSTSSQRRNSVDSQLSISVRRFSIESQKRNSFDSTVSMQAVEVTKTMRQIPRSKRRREERKAKREARKEAKQSSNASQNISNLELEILQALNIVNYEQSSSMPTTTNRRFAITNIGSSTLKFLNHLGDDILGDNVPGDNMQMDSSKSGSDSETESCNETDPLK